MSFFIIFLTGLFEETKIRKAAVRVHYIWGRASLLFFNIIEVNGASVLIISGYSKVKISKKMSFINELEILSGRWRRNFLEMEG